MRRWMLTVVLVLLAAVLAAPSVMPAMAAPAAGAAGARAATPPVPQLSWSDCGGGFQCATAAVPLDYDQPGGQQISLALTRLPASDPAHKIGSIFLNPGGPGGSGVDFVRAAGPVLFSDQVRARFDLVGFDPRGVVGSTPLRCFDTFQQALGALAPFPFPVTPAEEATWVGFDRQLAGACAQHGGAIRDHMATADVARDLDLLRQAVGDRQLTYFGQSYGSYLGTTYANLFPDRVRALVVDSVPDPIAYATGRGDQARSVPFTIRVGGDRGSEQTLRGFFALCDRGGANCAFSQGDPHERYDALAARLLAHPLALPDGQGGTVLFTYADLIRDTQAALRDPSTWPDLAQLLQLLDTMSSPPAAASAARQLRARLGLGRGGFQQEDYPNFVEGFPGVACSDTQNPDSVDAWVRAADQAADDSPHFGRIWTWLTSICQPWPGRDADRYLGPFTARTANPVLIVGVVNDPNTPYRGAVTLSRLLANSRLLTLDGWGHVAINIGSACVDAHVSAYLLTGQVPPRGTVCQPNVIPFAQPAAALRGAGRPAASAALVPPLLRLGS